MWSNKRSKQTISRYLVFDYLSEELAGTLVLGIGEETFGICYLYYFTIIHENNTIAHLAGKAHFMGHANHCHASVGQIDNNIQHFRKWIRGPVPRLVRRTA